MSTTRSQKRRNEQQGDKDVSEGFISPIVMENPCSSNQDVDVSGPSRPKSPRIENSFLESLRASLKDEITSEIKTLLAESQREMLKLLKPETRGSIRENTEEEVEEETRNFYTPTKSVRIGSTQNDSITCRNRDRINFNRILAQVNFPDSRNPQTTENLKNIGLKPQNISSCCNPIG